MKQLIATGIAGFLALASGAAYAQVYGGEDDPYQQNPFASNMTVPDPSTTQSDTPSTPQQPAQTDTSTGNGNNQQTTASSNNSQDSKTQGQR